MATGFRRRPKAKTLTKSKATNKEDNFKIIDKNYKWKWLAVVFLISLFSIFMVKRSYFQLKVDDNKSAATTSSSSSAKKLSSKQKSQTNPVKSKSKAKSKNKEINNHKKGKDLLINLCYNNNLNLLLTI